MKRSTKRSKSGTNKAQELHQMALRQFTHQQFRPDVEITPQQWEPDMVVSVKHDDLYARAWEGEYERPIYDTDYENAMTASSIKLAVKYEADECVVHQESRKRVLLNFVSKHM